ncbi:NHL repeat [Dillenia turbinata]|uniref:NHL repeat n=1 Tax=Dillenia turbinata TaxID=194707 RepID=A0AAN8VE72_9MAGN
MRRVFVVPTFIFVILFSGYSSASASPPAKIISGILSSVASALVKWLWSLNSTPKTAISGRSMMKFEGGYTVDTVFDGKKLGIEPHSLEVPKIIAGSPEGYTGHVDGRLRDARMNHPKGLAVDDRGNIYIADTMNMAIRKISDTGVTTIAGGKWGKGGGHVDGPSEDAKFSDDFDLVYVPSSCSLLVIDRGNQAIREIQLHFDDCDYQYGSNLDLGIAMLAAAIFFGYMLALLQRRVASLFSYQNDDPGTLRKGTQAMSYQRSRKSSHRPPLIPSEYDLDKPEEGFFTSLGRLVLNTGSTVAEILGGIFSAFRRKPVHHRQYYQQASARWPVQESYVIPEEDEPPSIEARDTTPRKTYPFMTHAYKEIEKSHQIRQSRVIYNSGWDENMHSSHQQQHKQQQHQYHQRHYTTKPKTHFEQSCETKEIVFGAVQEQGGSREAVVIKAVDYGDPMYNHYNIRPRLNYMTYS